MSRSLRPPGREVDGRKDRVRLPLSLCLCPSLSLLDLLHTVSTFLNPFDLEHVPGYPLGLILFVLHTGPT